MARLTHVMTDEPDIAGCLTTPASRKEVEAAWSEHFTLLRRWSPRMTARPVVWLDGPGAVPSPDVLDRCGAASWGEVLGSVSYEMRGCAGSGMWFHWGPEGPPPLRPLWSPPLSVRFDVATRCIRATPELSQVEDRMGYFTGVPGTVLHAGDDLYFVANDALVWHLLWGGSGNPFLSLLRCMSRVSLAWVLPDRVLCLEFPEEVHLDAENLPHREDGPAVRWGGREYDFRHGKSVPDAATQSQPLKEGADAAEAPGGEAPMRWLDRRIADLSSPDRARRWRASEELRRLGAEVAPAVRRIAQALQHRDPEVRAHAACLLGVLRRPAARAVLALVEALKDAQPDVRAAAAEALGDIENRRAVPALVAALRDPERDVRDKAAWALSKFGPRARRAVPVLEVLLEDPDRFVRRNAAQALAAIGCPAVPALIRALQAPERRVRHMVAEALWDTLRIERTGWSKALLPVLTPALEDEQSGATVRALAVEVLADIRGRKALPRLLQALADPEEVVRRNAARALARLGPAAVPVLMGTLRNGDATRRMGAVEALAGFLDLAKRHPQLAWYRLALRFGLLRRVHEQALRGILLALQDASDCVRAAAIRVLGGDALPAPIVAALIGLLKDPAARIRWLAAWALGWTGSGTAAVPALMEAFHEEDPDLRWIAAWALGRLGAGAADAPALIRAAADDSDWRVRRAAVTALGRLGILKAEARAGLRVLQDPDWRVRQAAAEALRGCADEEGVYEALWEVAKDEDPAVRRAAVEVLEGPGPGCLPEWPVVAEWLKDSDWGVRQTAARMLSHAYGAGIAEDVEMVAARLIEAFDSPDDKFREAVVKSLTRLPPLPTHTAPKFLEGLQDDPSPAVRELSAELLGRMADPGEPAVSQLRAALEDPARSVRRAAKSALHQLCRRRSR